MRAALPFYPLPNPVLTRGASTGFIDGRDWRLMQELFVHLFEQFGEQALLLIFCGPKGNSKTLRTERAMRVFVEGWVHMSGPSSAKSGMQAIRLAQWVQLHLR